jgi:CheY-like chemotaxis protein
VEDNRSDIFVVKEILKQLELETSLQVARDGEQALKFWASVENDLQDPCPDLVLLDLNIPKVSGLEVLSRIRGSRHCAGVPVVILTSSDSRDDLAAIRSLNASAYFRKPADLAAFMELGKVIQRLLPESTVSR